MTSATVLDFRRAAHAQLIGSRTLTVTRWPCLPVTTGEQVTMTWRSLVKLLRRPQRWLGEREHPGWSAAVFEPSIRAKENVCEVTALVLDVDRGDRGLLCDLGDVWCGTPCVIHSTRRHTPEAPRGRVVLALSRPVSVEEHAELWAWAAARCHDFGIQLDDNPKDCSRFWFLPGTRDGSPHFVDELRGVPLDVDRIVAECRERRGDAAKPPPANPAHIDCILPGARNAKLTAFAGTMRRHGLGEAGIAAALEAVNGAVCSEPLPKSEVARIARSIARYPAGLLGARNAETEPITWTPTAERARRLGARRGDRLATGVRAFDDACRGGLPRGTLVVVGGAPGTAKTMLAVQLARHWIRAGHSVAYVAADGGADDVLVRWGQLAGLGRDDLEAGAAHALDALVAELEGIGERLVLDDLAPVEDAVEKLAHRAGGSSTGVLIVDGVQTVCADGSAAAETPRARVDTNMRALRSAARSRGLLVVATSELARGAYRSRRADEHIEPLASPKESGGIEYAADVLIILRSVADAGGIVEALVAKNRLGRRATWRMRIDFARAQLDELPPETTPDPHDDGREREIEGRIVARVNAEPGVSLRGLRATAGCGHPRADRAIERLVGRGAIHVRRERGRVAHHPGAWGSTP
jgi:KaiC/GvpD/RAD55 family RecA-like ATPase